MDPARTVPSLLLMAASLALAVCASPASIRHPDGPPTVRGTVAAVQHGATASGLSVEAPAGACGMEATADAETRVLRRSPDGALVPVGVGAAGAGALAVGDTVAVWTDGPVMESCPMQARAAVVVVGAAPGAGAARPDSLDPLLGRWVHAAEEDAGGAEVYRPEGSREFSPRMYRQRYAFFEGGRAEVLVPHPADAHYTAGGTWSLTPDSVLVVHYEGRTDRLRVVELTPDLLRIRRIGG